MGVYRGSLVAILTAALVMCAAAQGSDSGGQVPSCAAKLADCAAYLNATTKPPSTCCDPLKEAVEKERACLCSIYNNPALLTGFGINITQALGLPKLCGIDIGKNANLCEATTPTKSPSAGTPPTTTGGGESGSSKNAAGVITGTNSGLVSVLLVVGTYLWFYYM